MWSLALCIEFAFADKILLFAVLKQWLLQLRDTIPVLFYKFCGFITQNRKCSMRSIGQLLLRSGNLMVFQAVAICHLRFLNHIACAMYIDAVYCYRPSCVVCRSVCYTSEPHKNGWTDWDAVLIEDSGGPRESCTALESRSPREKEQFWGRRGGQL